ncbi:TPA: glycosyltransferase family 4 protein [Providencia rettgeri]|nr:glycosyltransferase family 4 protein [Providencia rettgeri]
MNILFGEIVHIVPSNANAGPVNVAKDIVYGLNNIGKNATIFCLRNENRKGLLSNILLLYRTLKKSNNIKILHSHGIIPDLICFMLSFITNFKWISTMHLDPEEDLRFLYPKSYRFICFFWRLILKRTNSTVYLTEYIHSKQKSKNTCFIHNSRLIKKIEVINPNLNKNNKTLGFCGVLIERKNIINLVSSFPNNTDINLLVAGDGPLQETLLKISKENVTYLGHQNDLSYFWKNIEILILPSFAEGVPLVAIEAIARGIPLILMNLDNYKNVFTNNEAFFISHLNEESLIHAIEHIYKNYNHYSQSALNAYSHNFNFEKWIKKYIDLYSKD